jgi:hypothetical protein
VGRRLEIFYFLLSAVAAPRFGLAAAFGTMPADATSLFMPALGFFGLAVAPLLTFRHRRSPMARTLAQWATIG